MTRRSDGRWVETITLPDGKRKYIYGSSKSEVMKKLRAFEEDRCSVPSFGEVADEWIKQIESEVSHKTLSGYSPALRRILDTFANVPITDIEAADIQAFLRSVKAKGFSKSYINMHKIVFSKVFEHEILKRGGAIKTNPVAFVKTPRSEKQKKIHAATPEQEQTVKQSLSAPFGLFAFFLLYTGCRSQEALAVRWQDIDFEKNIIHINKAVTFPHNKAVIKATKTESGTRDIPLLDPLKAALEKNVSGADTFVFSSGNGKSPLSQEEYRKRWRQYSLAVGFREEYFTDGEGNRLSSLSELQRIPHKRIIKTTLTPHQLRHSFATMCFEAALAPEDAQKLLGHADIQTTVNIYTDIRETKKAAAAAKLNAFVSSAEKGY